MPSGVAMVGAGSHGGPDATMGVWSSIGLADGGAVLEGGRARVVKPAMLTPVRGKSGDHGYLTVADLH